MPNAEWRLSVVLRPIRRFFEAEKQAFEATKRIVRGFLRQACDKESQVSLGSYRGTRLVSEHGFIRAVAQHGPGAMIKTLSTEHRTNAGISIQALSARPGRPKERWEDG